MGWICIIIEDMLVLLQFTLASCSPALVCPRSMWLIRYCNGSWWKVEILKFKKEKKGVYKIDLALNNRGIDRTFMAK